MQFPGISFAFLLSFNLGLIVAESERKKILDQFLYAEQELAAAKGREQALQEQLLNEVSESQERLRKQIQLNSELQVCFLRWLINTMFCISMSSQEGDWGQELPVCLSCPESDVNAYLPILLIFYFYFEVK